MADGPAFAATFAVRQRWSPAALRGQIFTTAASLKMGAFALGAALSGPVVLALGARPVLAAVGAAQLAAVAAGWLAAHSRT